MHDQISDAVPYYYHYHSAQYVQILGNNRDQDGNVVRDRKTDVRQRDGVVKT